MHERYGLGRRATRREHLLLVGEGISRDHRRGREVAEYELVALLGDRRGGRNIDNVGDAFLLGDLCDGRALAGVEGAHQQLSAIRDQPLGTRARDVHIGLRVGVHDLEVGQTEALQNRTRDLDAHSWLPRSRVVGAGVWQSRFR